MPRLLIYTYAFQLVTCYVQWPVSYLRCPTLQPLYQSHKHNCVKLRHRFDGCSCQFNVMTGVLGFDSRLGLGIFPFTTVSRPGPHPASYPMGKAAESWSWPHLHLVPRSGMRGAIPPLPQYAFMAWCSVKSIGTTLPLPWICLWI
jgi:hypothetical protein